MKSSVQPAWVLGRRAYRDSSLLVELLTADSGRASVIVKGAHRKQRGGSYASLMQPFCPILVGLGGNVELKYLVSAESAGVAITLPGEQLFSGLYMNELLVRLLPKWDSAPPLFARYGVSLSELSTSQDASLILRKFEITLFDELGYEIQWDRDHRGRKIQPHDPYVFAPDRGFIESEQMRSADALLGSDLLAIRAWYHDNQVVEDRSRQVLKQVMRQAIDHRLDGRPLKVREAFAQWRSLGQREGEG